MIASLPMYDTVGTRDANDRFWQAIQSTLGHGPRHLTRGTDPHTDWTSPDLLFSQTCGLPFRTELVDRVNLIGTPDYGLPDCSPGYYCSYFIVQRDDPRTALADFEDATLARNDIRSQSGWAAVIDTLSAQGLGDLFSKQIIDTGAHAASIRAVAEKRADIAAIDALTWTLLSDLEDTCARVRILCATRPTPGLPYITGLNQDPSALYKAVERAIDQLCPEDRSALHLKSLVFIAAETYFAEPVPPVFA